MLFLTLLSLITTFASAAPAGEAIPTSKRDVVRREFAPGYYYPYSGYQAATGYFTTGYGYATGTASGYASPTSSSSIPVSPISTSSSSAPATTTTCTDPTATPSPSTVPLLKTTDSCPENGVVVCDGETRFGLCNFGYVVFRPVADGTACRDGKIVFAGRLKERARATFVA